MPTIPLSTASETLNRYKTLSTGRFHKEVQDLFPEFVQNKLHKFILKKSTLHIYVTEIDYTIHKSIHKPAIIKQTFRSLRYLNTSCQLQYI